MESPRKDPLVPVPGPEGYPHSPGPALSPDALESAPLLESPLAGLAGLGRRSLPECLEALYNEADLVKVNSMRRIAEELNRPDGEGRDVQKESQTVLKSIEIQLRLLSERRRNDDRDFCPALEDIWQALLNLPEAGSILRRDSVRARLLEALRQRLG